MILINKKIYNINLIQSFCSIWNYNNIFIILISSKHFYIGFFDFNTKPNGLVSGTDLALIKGCILIYLIKYMWINIKNKHIKLIYFLWIKNHLKFFFKIYNQLITTSSYRKKVVLFYLFFTIFIFFQIDRLYL